MSRSLSDIYNEAVATKNQYLQLTELNNDSKMSVINALIWVVSAAIYSFETLQDVFITDIAGILNERINGTPAYYAKAMLQWQYGDDLVVSDDGVSFSYATEDETKRLITHVSYQEIYSAEYKDDVLILKVAKGDDGELQKLSDEELMAARTYLNQIKFAGVKARVVSREGDVLVPRVTVYTDGAITRSDLYDAIDEALEQFIADMDFDSALYAHKVIDAIMSVDHVTDVYVDSNASVEQGIFVAQYDDDGNIGALTKVDRKLHLSSGYAKQSTKTNEENNLPKFREAITVKYENEE